MNSGMSSEQIYKPGLYSYTNSFGLSLYTPVFEIRCRKDWLETLNLSFPDVQLFPPIFVIEVHASFASLVICLTVNCFIHSSIQNTVTYIPPCRRDIFNVQTYVTDVRNYVLFCFTIFEEFCFCKFPALLFNRFFLFLSVIEDLKMSPQASVSLKLDRAKCYTLRRLKSCPYVCTPHHEDGRNGNKAACILYLHTWIRAFSFSLRPLYPGGKSNLCPLLEEWWTEGPVWRRWEGGELWAVQHTDFLTFLLGLYGEIFRLQLSYALVWKSSALVLEWSKQSE